MSKRSFPDSVPSFSKRRKQYLKTLEEYVSKDYLTYSQLKRDVQTYFIQYDDELNRNEYEISKEQEELASIRANMRKASKKINKDPLSEYDSCDKEIKELNEKKSDLMKRQRAAMKLFKSVPKGHDLFTMEQKQLDTIKRMEDGNDRLAELEDVIDSMMLKVK